MSDREEFEKQFAKHQCVSLGSVVACRASDGGYWDDAHCNTRGISLAWLFFKIGRGLV